jgi:hypothetical protein
MDDLISLVSKWGRDWGKEKRFYEENLWSCIMYI